MALHVLHATRLRSPRERDALVWRRAGLAVFIAVLLVALVALQRSGLQRASFSTGYALFGAVLFLLSIHWRKQAPSLPLGKVSTWLQYHVYVGYLAIVLFGLHVQFRLPTGVLETILFIVFSIVAGSGLFGLYLTRTVPCLLRMLPQEAIYEQIPALQRQVMEEARQIILTVADDSAALVDFYKMKLAPFIEQQRSIWYFLYPNSRRRRLLVGQLQELHRFLNETRRRDCRELERLLCRKDDLDFQAALQGRLKLWMWVHIGFSYSLLVLAAVHGLLAHAFSGGVR